MTAVTWALEKELGKAWSQTSECGSESGSLQSQLFVPVVLSVKLRILRGEVEGSTGFLNTWQAVCVYEELFSNHCH